MPREPAYPEDAPVEAPQPGSGKNEVVKAVEEKKAASRRARKIVTGAAIGIGSAALVAALLYANRTRKGGDEGK